MAQNDCKSELTARLSNSPTSNFLVRDTRPRADRHDLTQGILSDLHVKLLSCNKLHTNTITDCNLSLESAVSKLTRTTGLLTLSTVCTEIILRVSRTGSNSVFGFPSSK